MKQTAVEWLDRWFRDNPEATHEEGDKALEQAKEMEQEQMIKFAEFVASYPDKNRNAYGERLHAKSKYDGAERTVDLLEQYYKETYGSKGSDGSSLEWNGEVTQGHNLKPKYTPGKGISFYMEKEISDEEIQKAAESQATFAPSFVRGAKWYREQLKSRQ